MTKRLCTLLCLFVFCTLTVFAQPEATMELELSNFRTEGEERRFTATVFVTASPQAYSALDFSVVLQTANGLSIRSQPSQTGGEEPAVTFAPGYGKASGGGRVDEAAGETSYLMGLYSASAKNEFSERLAVCALECAYSGDSTAELRISGLHLVYIDENRQVQSVRLPVEVKQSVTPDLFASTIKAAQVPLASARKAYFAIATAAAAGAVLIFVIRRRGAAKPAV